jgi:lipooligosaccharide transport system permease protein
MAATAMQIASFEASWPVLAAIKWDRQYHAMLATPLRIRDVVLGHQAYFAFRLLSRRRSTSSSSPRSGRESPLGCSRSRDGARRALVLGADRGLGGARAERGVVRRDLPFHHPPDVPLLGDVLPDLDSAEPLEIIAWFTPLWHGVTLCRDLTLGTSSVGDLLHVAYLLAFVSVGLVGRASRTRGGSCV